MIIKRIVFISSWILTCTGLLMFLLSEKLIFLLFITIGLGIISFLEYMRFKKNDKLNYLNSKLVFIYAIGALFSLYIYISERYGIKMH